MKGMQTVLIAGGLGTRSLDPTTPKVLQSIGEETLLERHLDHSWQQGIRHVLVIGGHQGDMVKESITEIKPRFPGLSITYVHDDKMEGTLAALRLALSAPKTERYLVVLGDVLTSFPILDMFERWKSSGKDTACLVHPNLHPKSSDIMYADFNNRLVLRSKREQLGFDLRNSAVAGVYMLTLSALSKIKDSPGDLFDFIIDQAQIDNALALKCSHLFFDCGTPERLTRAQKAMETGAFPRRGSLRERSALFLDRDGVINPDDASALDPESYTLLPGVGEQIALANSLGIPVIVITNQPALAKGHLSQIVHEEIRVKLDALLLQHTAFIDDYYYCPHHPDSGFPGEKPSLKTVCSCRKPKSFLFALAASHHRISLANSVFVGDSWRDEGAALTIGASFIHVRQGDSCSLQSKHKCQADSATAIRSAIGELR